MHVYVMHLCLQNLVGAAPVLKSSRIIVWLTFLWLAHHEKTACLTESCARHLPCTRLHVQKMEHSTEPKNIYKPEKGGDESQPRHMSGPLKSATVTPKQTLTLGFLAHTSPSNNKLCHVSIG